MAFNPYGWSPSQASAIIFDWDGVIARTDLDFSKIKKKYFGDRPAMLLEDMPSLPPDEQKNLARDLEEIEMRGAETAAFVPGVTDVLEWVRAARIPWAVVSRNCRGSILTAAKEIGMRLPSIVRSRDDGDCVKPDPRALFETCSLLSVPPAQTLLIGDYIYDMIGARRAGMRGALVRGKTEDGWEPWLEYHRRSMSEFYEDLVTPPEIIPWEYQETARGYGAAFLKSAAKISLAVPDAPRPSLDVWIARAASLGVARFIAADGEFSPETWKANPSFDPRFMGQKTVFALSDFLRVRWPFASVAERPGESEKIISDAPDDADEIAAFLLEAVKATG
jgi:HAD superfamily hydrolase (TIGR01509 family)